jgi:outer membrane protein TolC
MADGSFGFRQDQVNNQWIQVAPGQYAPLDANGKPFNPKTEPSKIMWKDYALLPKEAMEIDVENVFVGGIGFTQPIFLGGKIRELYNIAKAGEKLAEVQNSDEANKLIIEVDEAYWRVVSVENKKRLAQEYCNLLEKLVKNVNIMVEEGVATKGDALKVKVKLNEAEMSLTKADNGLRLSKMALYQLCGLEISSEYILADNDLTQNQIDIVNPDINSVLNSRAEIKALNIMQSVAKSNIKIMQSRFMPNVLLSANYLVSNPSFSNGVSNTFNGMFSVGVVMNVPIFHFGDKVHTLRAAKSQFKISQYKIDEAKEKIELQVNQSSFRMMEANKQLFRCESNLEKANENLRFANEAFDAGVISSTDLMAAQTAWLSANSERIDSNIEVRLCDLYLKKVIGNNLSE